MQLDEYEEQEKHLQRMLEQAQAATQTGPEQEAETLYTQALHFAESKFGENSSFVAIVLLQLSCFYNKFDKPHSARLHRERLMRILRW